MGSRGGSILHTGLLADAMTIIFTMLEAGCNDYNPYAVESYLFGPSLKAAIFSAELLRR